MSTLLAAFNKSIASELNDRLTRGGLPNLDWSDEQAPIIKWFAEPSESASPTLVVVARAGTGKTTTIMGAVGHAPESTSITAKTLHSLGFGVVRRFWEGVKISSGNNRAWKLAAGDESREPASDGGGWGVAHTTGRLTSSDGSRLDEPRRAVSGSPSSICSVVRT